MTPDRRGFEARWRRLAATARRAAAPLPDAPPLGLATRALTARAAAAHGARRALFLRALALSGAFGAAVVASSSVLLRADITAALSDVPRVVAALPRRLPRPPDRAPPQLPRLRSRASLASLASLPAPTAWVAAARAGLRGVLAAASPDERPVPPRAGDHRLPETPR